MTGTNSLLLIAPILLTACVTPRRAADFPLVDYHVHLKGGLTLDQAIEISEKNGVKFGIAQNCGLGFPVTDDAGAMQFIEMLKGRDAYIGMQAEGREWLGLFSKDVIARFDYVFTDALTFTDDKGRRTRLWRVVTTVVRLKSDPKTVSLSN